jgi:hypothetical protein
VPRRSPKDDSGNPDGKIDSAFSSIPTETDRGVSCHALRVAVRPGCYEDLPKPGMDCFERNRFNVVIIRKWL